MPHNSAQWVRHRFGGGWATDYGRTFYGSPEGSDLSLPWLNKAHNIQFTIDGRIQKAPGTDVFSTSSGVVIPLRDLEGNTLIRGTYDYVRGGTSGSPSQQTIIACGNDYFKYNTFAVSRIGSFYGTTINLTQPNFSTFNDLLILANSDTSTPYSWDQTTFQVLAGSPPTFAFSTPHRGRQWASGNPSVPHRLYYSAAGNPEDWVGAGSGSIDIDPGDGDSIVALWSWKNELWVFKGPYKLSIHRISGSSPSDFVRTNFITGISAANQSNIFSYGDDILFWNPRGSLHSLVATNSYGDYAQAYLNYPILKWCQANLPDLSFAQSAINPSSGYALTNVYSGLSPANPMYGATINNLTLYSDLRFIASERYPRFALWPYLGGHSISFGKNVSGVPKLIGGDGNGYVYEIDRNEGIDSNGLTYTHLGKNIRQNFASPYLTYGPNVVTKTLEQFTLNLAPDEYHSATVNVAWSNEKGFAQTNSITRSFGVPLGTFLLGTDSLATNAGDIGVLQEPFGDFRSVQYEFSEESNKKVTIQNFGSLWTPTGESAEA